MSVFDVGQVSDSDLISGQTRAVSGFCCVRLGSSGKIDNSGFIESKCGDESGGSENKSYDTATSQYLGTRSKKSEIKF